MMTNSKSRLGNAFFAGLSCLLISELAHGYPKGDTNPGGSSSSITHIEALMPEYPTDHAEMYLCTSVLLPDEPLKLVGVEPLSKEEVVHHMLLFGESSCYKATNMPLEVYFACMIMPTRLACCDAL